MVPGTVMTCSPSPESRRPAADQHFIIGTPSSNSSTSPKAMIALGLGTGQGPKAPIPGQAVPASGHRDPRSARPCSAPGPQPGTAVQIHDAYSGGCHAHVCEFWPAAAWDDDADIYPERTVVRPPGSRPPAHRASSAVPG
jgi:hypothetical protein